MIVAQKLRDATDIFGTGPQLIPLIDGTVGIPERIGEGYPDQGGAPGPDLSDDENSVLEEIEGTLDDTTLPPPLNIRTIAGKDYIAQGSTPSNMYIHEGNRIVMQPLEGNPVFVGVIEEDGRIVILEGHKNEGLFGLTLEALDGLYFDGQGFSVR